MKTKLIASAALLLSFSAVSAFAESWKGTISDEMCSTKHAAATPADVACAQKCVKMGSAAVFVSDGKVFKIENQDAVKEHVGHKVTLTGTMKDGTIHVDSVKM